MEKALKYDTSVLCKIAGWKERQKRQKLNISYNNNN